MAALRNGTSLVVLLFAVPALAGEVGSAPAELTHAEWAGIRAALHDVVAVEDGHVARNPGQRWTTRFDGSGFTVTPDRGEWTWGLELVRWGRAGDEREIVGTAGASADGGRLEREWDAALVEWYVNDARGLEHGFIVRERPEGGGALRFELAVRGALRPELHADGRGARFVDEGGAAALIYSGLTVLDADGGVLPARFDAADDRLVLSLDDRGARYPLTVDPIAQQAYLKASNTGANDWFGWSVSLDGDVALVGAYLEDSSATGVDGDGGDNGASASGAAYVYDLAATGPFSPFCFGSAAACPCGNTGYPVHGCDNAQGTGGVKLSATGTPALNDVVLHGSSFPPAGAPAWS